MDTSEAAWAAWIGRTSRRQEVLHPEQANRMAVTVDREPCFRVGDPLPPAWHWLYFHDVVRAGDLGEEGHPRLGVTMPPVPLPRRMWAGGRLSFVEPLILGAQAERVSQISAITPKTGRGGPLVFVTVTHEVVLEGRVGLREEQTIVYREMTSPAREPERVPVVDVDLSDRWALDATALFRYSALTFNGHRIHYDVDYCRDVEGYPNLVVHGPLLATLLLDLLVRGGRPLHEFSYRARSPVFLPDEVTLDARFDGEGTVLRAHAGTGLAMEATAR